MISKHKTIKSVKSRISNVRRSAKMLNALPKTPTSRSKTLRPSSKRTNATKRKKKSASRRKNANAWRRRSATASACTRAWRKTTTMTKCRGRRKTERRNLRSLCHRLLTLF